MSTDDEAECTTGNDAAEKQLEEEARSQRRVSKSFHPHLISVDTVAKKGRPAESSPYVAR